MQSISDFITEFVVVLPAILISLTVHEASHAMIANWRGDPTARMLGRITLNPLKHLDPFGTMVFIITALAGAGIGWAKPVPVDHRNLKDPQHDHMWISAAGPVSNILAASIIAITYHLFFALGLLPSNYTAVVYLALCMQMAIWVNVVFAFFNLIPIPPLDGSGVVAGFLPPRLAMRYYDISRYGMMIILALVLLPSWIPGFPSILRPLVLTPASWLVRDVLGVL